MTHPGMQTKQTKRWPWVVGGAVLVVIGIGQLGDGASEAGARVACENFVTDRLMSPTSANFSRPDVTENNGLYTVAGHVDADNRAGAAMRIDYDCVVRHTGGDDWRLVQLDHNER